MCIYYLILVGRSASGKYDVPDVRQPNLSANSTILKLLKTFLVYSHIPNCPVAWLYPSHHQTNTLQDKYYTTPTLLAIMPQTHHTTYTSCHNHIMPHTHHATNTPCHIHIMLLTHHATYTSCHMHIMLQTHNATYTSCHIHIMLQTHHATYTSCHKHIMLQKTSCLIHIMPQTHHAHTHHATKYKHIIPHTHDATYT